VTGRLVLGVDGGGTKTEAWLAELTDAGEPVIIGRGLAASSNPRAVGMETACTNLGLVVDAAFADAKRPVERVSVAVLALSGAGHQSARDKIAVWATSHGVADSVRFEHDAEPVLVEGTPAGRGIALIVGTGSAAIGVNANGEKQVVGGWGYHYGDEGSAYWIGREALMAIARAADGRGAATELTKTITARLQVDDPRAMLAALEKSGNVRGAIASLADAVELAAQHGDEVALKIVERGSDELAHMVGTLSQQLQLGDKFPLALAGGVICGSQLLRDKLAEQLKRRSVSPEPVKTVPHPAAGCVKIACRAIAQDRGAGQ
jgi:N-acetylglucosamine kinase-like BadF-type ATPase